MIEILQSFVSKLTGLVASAISKVCKPEPIIQDSDVSDIASKIQPGDLLVSRTDYELSNVVEKLLTGSFWGHAAIYLDGYVYEAVTKGVRKTSLEKFCYTKDAVGLGRLPGPAWTPDQLAAMKAFCESKISEPYDYSLIWGTMRKWYCSKLVYFAWKTGAPKDVAAIQTTDELDMIKITPQNVWNSCQQIQAFGEPA